MLRKYTISCHFRGSKKYSPLKLKEFLQFMLKKYPIAPIEVLHYYYLFIYCRCRFPLFTAVHRICKREMDPKDFIDCLREHPEHMQWPSPAGPAGRAQGAVCAACSLSQRRCSAALRCPRPTARVLAASVLDSFFVSLLFIRSLGIFYVFFLLIFFHFFFSLGICVSPACQWNRNECVWSVPPPSPFPW